jgi:hypothetical protein
MTIRLPRPKSKSEQICYAREQYNGSQTKRPQIRLGSSGDSPHLPDLKQAQWKRQESGECNWQGQSEAGGYPDQQKTSEDQ